MTPRDVDSLTYDEYKALWEYAEERTRDAQREARRARRR